MNIPEGWKLVPVEPTGEMIEAGKDARMHCFGIPSLSVESALAHIYDSMLKCSSPPNNPDIGVEFEPDSVCVEPDGCPTEGAVLKRFWRENKETADNLLSIDRHLRGKVNDPDPLPPILPGAYQHTTTYGLVAGIRRERDSLRTELEELRALLREVAELDPRGEFLGWALDGRIDTALTTASPSTINQQTEIAREALKMPNQRITPARFKCLACGDYHEGSGNLPCPKMSPYSTINQQGEP